MRIYRTHRMTQEDAKEWVTAQIPSLMRQFSDSLAGVQQGWEGFTLNFRFMKNFAANFKGTLTVTDTDLELDLPFPFMSRGLEAGAKTDTEKWFDENLPKQITPSSEAHEGL